MNLVAKLALIAAGLLATTTSTHADELVVNGGFETGDFSGWTEFGDTFYNGVWDGYPRTGTYSAYFGPTLDFGGIEQTITANAGTQVTVSFWYLSEFGDLPNSITVRLGSVTLLDRSNVEDLEYVHFTTTLTLTETNPVLNFAFTDPPDYLDLDDVSVTGSLTNPCGSADFDCDGDTGTDFDIQAFFACLGGTCPQLPCTSTADFDGDGDTGTDFDIQAFFRVLGGSPC